MSTPMDSLRDHLVRLLDWQDAHVNFDSAVDGVPLERCGSVPAGLPHSVWQLVEHIRVAQHDIHDFCVNANYREMHWPDDYWPAAAPPSAVAWEASVKAVGRDRERLKALAREQPDLTATVPHGSGHTFLRAILLAADHASYHVGQIVLVRRLLGCWNGPIAWASVAAHTRRDPP